MGATTIHEMLSSKDWLQHFSLFSSLLQIAQTAVMIPGIPARINSRLSLTAVPRDMRQERCLLTFLLHSFLFFSTLFYTFLFPLHFYSMGPLNSSVEITGWRKKRGHRPSYLIANIPKTQWPNCMKIGGLLQYYMLNTVINFLFKNFIARRHLAKTQLLSFIHIVQIDLSITQ